MQYLLTQLKILKPINNSLSSINELSGNNFSKSQSCVIMDTDPLDSLILSDPFLTQNTEMWPALHKLLHLDHSFLQYKHKLSLMKTFVFPGNCTDSGFKFLSFFLFDKILWMSLRRFNLTVTFFDEPLEDKRKFKRR